MTKPYGPTQPPTPLAFCYNEAGGGQGDEVSKVQRESKPPERRTHRDLWQRSHKIKPLRVSQKGAHFNLGAPKTALRERKVVNLASVSQPKIHSHLSPKCLHFILAYCCMLQGSF